MSQNQTHQPEKASRLEELFQKHGFSDFRWIQPEQIVVAQWVRMKCLFGCGEYGRNASCPPHVPPVSDCERFFRDYTAAAVFHFVTAADSPQAHQEWTRKTNRELLKLERAVFLSGYQKAFLLLVEPCNLCANCSGERGTCHNPRSARPTVEAFGMDVYATVRNVGYPIKVLENEQEGINRYAVLMIE